MTFIRMASYTIQQRGQIIECSFQNAVSEVFTVNSDRYRRMIMEFLWRELMNL